MTPRLPPENRARHTDTPRSMLNGQIGSPRGIHCIAVRPPMPCEPPSPDGKLQPCCRPQLIQRPRSEGCAGQMAQVASTSGSGGCQPIRDCC